MGKEIHNIERCRYWCRHKYSTETAIDTDVDTILI